MTISVCDHTAVLKSDSAATAINYRRTTIDDHPPFCNFRLSSTLGPVDDDDFFFPYNKNWTTLPKLQRRRNLFAGYVDDVVILQWSL